MIATPNASEGGGGGHLRRRVMTGSAWMTALRFSRKGAGFVCAIILAKLLSPVDYGLVAVGLLCISLTQTLTEFGVRTMLIQEHDQSDRMLWSAWTMEFLRGLLACLVVWFAAPLAASYFKKPEALWLVRAMSVIPLIQLSASIRTIEFYRKIQFHRQFAFEMTGAVTGLTVSVVLAFVLRNAWALAIGQLTIAVMANVLSYVYFPERPRFVLDRAAVGKLFGFGKWVVLTSLVSYVAMEGDRYVAGGRFGVAALGLYTFMSMLVKTIVLDIGKSVTNVFYPAYVLLRHDHRRLSDAFLRSYETLASVLAPSCLLLALVAGDFVTVVLDAKWAPGIGLLKILGIGGVAYALIASGSGLINGVGKPRFNTLGEFVRMLVLFAGLAWFPPRFGVAGVAIAMVGTNVLGAALYLMMWSRVLRMPLRRFARPLATVGATLAAVWGGVALVRPLAEPGGLRLVLTLGAAGLAYLAVLAAAAHWFRAGPLQHVFGGVAPGWQFAVGLPERLKMRNKPRTKPGDGRPGTDITPNS